MRPLPQEGTAEEGLCCSLLRLVQNDQQIQQLREELGGFSHRCRNLLNGMKMSLYFMRRGAEQPLPQWWDALELNYRGIEELLDHLQAIYRPISLTLIRGTFRCLIQDRQKLWIDWFASSCGTQEIVPPGQESVGEFDPMYLTMGLDALVRWRASAIAFGQAARITWRTREGRFEVSWQEVGATASTPSRPCTQTSSDSPSPWGAHQPLALPLLARVMTAHRGTMEWSRDPAFHALLRWPLNQSSEQPPVDDPPLTKTPACAYDASE